MILLKFYKGFHYIKKLFVSIKYLNGISIYYIFILFHKNKGGKKRGQK